MAVPPPEPVACLVCVSVLGAGMPIRGAMCVSGARGHAPAPEPVAYLVAVPLLMASPEPVAGVPTRGPVAVLVLCAYPWAMCVSVPECHQIERPARGCAVAPLVPVAGGRCRGQGAYLVAVPVLVPQPPSRWPVPLLVACLVCVSGARGHAACPRASSLPGGRAVGVSVPECHQIDARPARPWVCWVLVVPTRGPVAVLVLAGPPVGPCACWVPVGRWPVPWACCSWWPAPARSPPTRSSAWPAPVGHKIDPPRPRWQAPA